MFKTIKFSNFIIPTCLTLFLTGCATTTLLEKDNGVRTQNIKTTLGRVLISKNNGVSIIRCV